MPMTVGLIAPRYAPAIGGVERVAEIEARELARRGLRVEVLTTDPTRSLPATEEREGVLVRRFPTLGNDSVYFVSPALGKFLSAHADRYAVLHAHSYHTPLALQAALAGKRARVPFVVSTHYHGTGHSRLRRWLHVPYRPFGAWMVRSAAWVLCVSHVEQQLVRVHFGPRVRTLVTPNAIDADELARARRSEPSSGATGVLAVGRLDAYKQPTRIVDALMHLPSTTRLTLVGDGPLRTSLSRKGQGKQVQVLGQLSRLDLLGQYWQADVFVSLSRHESFGLAVLEAAVAGLPVVASDIPAHREVAEFVPPERIHFVPVDATASAVAAAIGKAGERGRVERVDGWPLPTWTRHVDLVQSSYESASREGRISFAPLRTGSSLRSGQALRCAQDDKLGGESV
ncbi:MAG TPA: glycosyltransferase family 4 protein [Chloroflexota bacterium]